MKSKSKGSRGLAGIAELGALLAAVEEPILASGLARPPRAGAGANRLPLGAGCACAGAAHAESAAGEPLVATMVMTIASVPGRAGLAEREWEASSAAQLTVPAGRCR